MATITKTDSHGKREDSDSDEETMMTAVTNSNMNPALLLVTNDTGKAIASERDHGSC